jgi:hypothetical protein
MYAGSFKIDDYLPLTVPVHDPSTGASSSADSSPSYRVYKNGNATPIVTGSLSALDATNALGIYIDRFQLTAVAGFAKGSDYFIVVAATVGSVTARTIIRFQIEAEVDSNTVSGAVPSVTSAVATNKDAVIDGIKEKTDTLPASPAAVGSPMTLQDNAITGAKFDNATAFPLKSADTGASEVARVGADGDTLKSLSDQIDGASTLNAAGVRSAVGLASANLDTQLGNIPNDAAIQEDVATVLAAYGVPTNTEMDSGFTAIDTVLSTLQSDIDDVKDGYLGGDWEFVDNQWIIYKGKKADGIVLKTFNMLKDGVPSVASPDSRLAV